MNNTQNEKINQVTDTTIVVGIDIGSETHYARAFNWRRLELSKKVLKFRNDGEGFGELFDWIRNLQGKHSLDKIIIGAEPTGHYWYNLAAHIQEQGIDLVFVNPYHVKQTKELDDNNQKKTDRKDPKTIAKLVLDGRYSYPYVPEGVYAELRTMVGSRFRISKELNAAKNRIQRWLKIYFPEHRKVFGQFTAVSSMMILKAAPLPKDIIELGADGINQIWRDEKLRAVGIKRAKTLLQAAEDSVGCEGGIGAKQELRFLMEDFEMKTLQYEQTMEIIEKLLEEIPHTEKLLAIKGVGVTSVAGFIAEVGDIGRFQSPKQIQKLAGLALKENSSGKHKGETTISKRGRSRLRAVLFQAVMPLIGKNAEFKSIHEYYTTRDKNPLKKKQSAIAVSCKLIRIFHVILTKGVEYDADKLVTDIVRPEELQAA